MARACAICGKGIMSGNNVSHSNRKTRRVWAPNLQRVKLNLSGTVRRVSVCTKCLKANRVRKVVRPRKVEAAG